MSDDDVDMPEAYWSVDEQEWDDLPEELVELLAPPVVVGTAKP